MVLPGHILNYNLLGGRVAEWVSWWYARPKCLRGLLRRLFGLKG